ncbi:SLC13 family permease [Robertkochia aurantiaca]|uniref:SLC13 family permease n=1 Tax=Robertkochia aurantiaca TaxID=2873700 RepID=UPI001CCA8559|nr:SLC13 family permease [Robertkochia sp. 3YJGBD-33]
MGADAYITLGVILMTLFLYLKEYFPVDLVALGVIVVLVLTGVITADQGLAGFSNQATLTVAAMFVLSHAIIKTQVLQYISPYITKLLEKGYAVAILSLGGIVGSISAFVNNTPIVATFIPIINSSSRKAGQSPSRFLMPLSFVAIFGGTCTLIGTSTNLLVSGMAADRGVDDFKMFTMFPFGIILFAVGMIYLMLFGKKLVPERSSKDELKEQEGVLKFLAEVRLRAALFEEEKNQCIADLIPSDITVKRINRDGRIQNDPETQEELHKDDILLIEGKLATIRQMIRKEKIRIRESESEKEFPEEETQLHEIVLLPNSELVDTRLKDINFLERYRSSVIAIRQRGKKKFKDLESIKLKAGDVLVLLSNLEGSELIKNASDEQQAPFLSLRVREVKKLNKKNLTIVLSCIAAVIILASTGLVPIVIAAFGAVVLLCFLGVMEIREAYQAIDWKVIFLLAGSLSLGEAMGSSGLSDQIGNLLIGSMSESAAPMIIVAVFYLTTSLLTELVSNNASAALMVPIAFSVAESMGVNVMPILLTIAFAGSASFLTPIGYQTNTMIYSAGSFQFRDFARVGAPLNLIFLILASLLIPVIYPFY